MANVNADTLKSIRLNIIDIIENTIKWKFEDGSLDGEREETYGVSMDLKEFNECLTLRMSSSSSI